MRVLCICARGNVRSANMAYLLKDHCNTEAIAIGFSATNAEARWFLMGWADKIIVLDQGAAQELSGNMYAAYGKKILHCMVPLSRSGLDCAYKPDELAKYEQFLKDNGFWPEHRRAFNRSN